MGQPQCRSADGPSAVLEQDWSSGDTVVLHLDVSERIVRARAEVAEVAGLVARMLGPR